jgi:hypothetical protein
MVYSKTLEDALSRWDIAQTQSESVRRFFMAAPGNVRTQVAFSQERRFETLDTDRATGCIRNAEHAFSKDGGLAVLSGNLALDGCIVKTAGVDDSILKFEEPARIFESQDAAVEGILGGKIKPGDVVVVRYEGPRGGPGMQEMLYPTSYLKSKGLGKVCALITDGRFSGGSSGLSIGHISPEAAEGGLIGLVEEGDRIKIDIPARSISLVVDEAIGLVFKPGEAPLWIVLFGGGTGATMILALSFLSFRATTLHGAVLSGIAQCVGYALAAAGPPLIGALREALGDWTVPLLLWPLLTRERSRNVCRPHGAY